MTPSHNHVGLSDGHLASLCHVEKLLLARNTITHTHNIGIPGKFGEQRLRKVIERSAKSSPPASHCATSQDWDSRPETAHSTLSSIAFSLPWFTHVKRFTGNTKPFSPCWWWNLLRIGSHQRLGYALYPTPHMREGRLSRISDWRKAYHSLSMSREGKWLRHTSLAWGERQSTHLSHSKSHRGRGPMWRLFSGDLGSTLCWTCILHPRQLYRKHVSPI